MRRGMWIWVVVLVVLASVGVGVAAYNAGVSRGLEQGGGEVVRVVGPGFGFPFGLILLLSFGTLFLIRAATWGRRWGRPGRWGGPGHWQGAGEHFEDWHRRQHGEVPEPPEGGSDRATV